MLHLATFIEAVNARTAQAIRWLTLVMVLVTLAVVLLRYAFDIGAIPLQESVVYMHGLVFLLGIPYGLQRDTHVRVDILYSKLKPARRRQIDIGGHVLFLLPVAAFIFVTSLPYVAGSWRVLEGSPEVGGLPAVFLLKTLIPVMAALLFLQGVASILKLTLAPLEDRT